MARPVRIEYPGAWYHVTCRGNEKKAIFGDDTDRITFLDILATSLELFHAELHAYVLMDNHFHLVLTTHEANLNRLMHRFNTSYTVYYNHRHGRSGHLYQGRYKAILIDADSYLLELSRYVHLNTVRTKKYSRVTTEAKKKIMERYRWSSYGGYIHPKERQPFVTYGKILSLFGDNDIHDASQYYEGFVLSGIADDMNITYWQDLKGQAVLGSKTFVEKVLKTISSKRQGETKALSEIRRWITIPDSIEVISKAVSTVCHVPEEALYPKRSAYKEARSIFMELSCLYLSRKMPLSELGQKLGGVSVAALSQNRRRLAERMIRDKTLQRQFEAIKEMVNKDNP